MLRAPETWWPSINMVPPAWVNRMVATRMWCSPNGNSNRSPEKNNIGPNGPAPWIKAPTPLIKKANIGQIIGKMIPTTAITNDVMIGTKRAPPKKAKLSGNWIVQYFLFKLYTIIPVIIPPSTPISMVWTPKTSDCPAFCIASASASWLVKPK